MDYDIMKLVWERLRPKYDWGEIYYLYCPISSKGYVGQAQKFVTGTRPHGTFGRWNSHNFEADNGLNTSIHLNNAIRKYGRDAFIVVKLKDCPIDELDKWETYYINLLGTFCPRGYNLTMGGRANWTISDETRVKLSRANKGKSKSDVACRNNGISQMGKRFDSRKGRKCKEDENLPKYIIGYRENGKLIGYKVSSFPIGVTKREQAPSKTFRNTTDFKEAYDRAIKYLDELKEMYPDVEKKIEITKARNTDKKLTGKKRKEKDLPEHINPIYENKVLIGYKLSGFVDYDGNIVGDQEFKLPSGNWSSLKSAMAQLRKLERDKKDKEFTEDPNVLLEYEPNDERMTNKKLPKYIRYTPSNNNIKGYLVEYIQKGKSIFKTFRGRSSTREEKYNAAVDFLRKLYKERDQQINQIISV